MILRQLLTITLAGNLKTFETLFIDYADFIPEELIAEMFTELSDFISTTPNLPDREKNYVSSENLTIDTEASREKIVNLIIRHSARSEMATLALYVYRQMDKVDWLPFVKAAIERNPVSFTDLNELDLKKAYSFINEFPNDSIYDGKRLALPDEVWNFRHGDGIEKAILLADFIIHRDKSSKVLIEIDHKTVILKSGKDEFHFISVKNFRKTINISWKNYQIH